jgi:23S rRNA pseudouridine1911/1915/1917 synthase
MEKVSLVFEGESERIDTWLTKQFSYSRNFFHHIIERGWVLVNWKAVKKSNKLKKWDTIEIDALERFISPVILDEAPDIDILIVKEEEDYLVINKPKGVLSHPNSIWDISKPSVVWFLYHRYSSLPSVGNFIRAGLLHRLDKDTDGLMIVAKTEKWLAHFKELFKEKSESEKLEDKDKVPLKKWYRAISEILPEWKIFLNKIEGNLPFVIQEVVKAKVPNMTPKMWITQVEKVEKISDKQVKLYLQIFTGRTHQIRYHLSSHWLPIVWDYLYWKEDKQAMQLTAYRLEFQNPYWEMVSLDI